MAKVGAQRAAELTGRSKSTIQRAMNSGKVSFELDHNNRRVIDTSELDRAFGLVESSEQSESDAALEKVSIQLESERLKMRIKMLETQLEMAEETIEDLKGQRDQWQKQASQILLTSEHNQKQADELREEIRQRDERVRLARQKRQQQRLTQRMQKLKAQNENTTDESVFSGFLRHFKGRA